MLFKNLADFAVQDAGKSSLIESLCSVPLPKANGMCTRCPIMLHIRKGSRKAQWKCQISVRRGDMEQAEKFSPVLSENAWEIERWLHQAQRAVLHPNISLDECRNYEMTESPEKEAEKNGILITEDPVIVDVEWDIDLNLIDLPGLTQASEGKGRQEMEIPKRTKEMVRKYIEDENTIIVAVFSAKEGMEQQVSHGVLKYLIIWTNALFHSVHVGACKGS